ncbi:MAG: amidohydrolase family protein, partial [Candidatus Magasanikbacteria bacterium]|nr:amidohydrolase family protein [Candidatus Magasanikbacteria bacterium]
MNHFSLSKRYNIVKPANEPRRVLIHGVRFIITTGQSGNIEILEHRSLLIDNGSIESIFPKEQLHQMVDLKALDMIYDAEQKGGVVVTPGFINLHAHPPMYLLRSTLTMSESNLGKALDGMAKIEAKMTDEDCYLGALGDFTEEQKSGITTTVSHYGVFDPIERAAAESNQHVINCVSAASNTHPENTPEFVAQFLRRKNTASTPGLALHYVWKATPATLKKIAKFLKQYDTYLTLNVAETRATVKSCVETYGERPIAVLKKYGLLGSRTIMSHAVHLNAAEIELIKKTNTKIVHLPTSNLLHRSGQFRYKMFHELGAGGLIGLGT